MSFFHFNFELFFSFSFSLFSCKVPRDDHITDGHHPKNWFSGIPTVHGAVQAAETSGVVASAADAFTSVTVLTTPSVPGDLTAAAEFVLGVFYPFYGSALGTCSLSLRVDCGPKARISSVFFSWSLPALLAHRNQGWRLLRSMVLPG